MGDELEDIRQRYEAVMDSLPQSVLDDIERRRILHKEDDPSAYYGHDMFAAIGRGYRRRSHLACQAALANTGIAVHNGRERGDKHRLEFSLTLDRLIEATLELGVTADEIELLLDFESKRSDRFKIQEKARRVEQGEGVMRE